MRAFEYLIGIFCIFVPANLIAQRFYPTLIHDDVGRRISYRAFTFLIALGLITIVLALFLLSGCAASSEQTDQAMRDMISCMKERANVLDDHRSDAGTIGYAVRSACSNEVHQSIAAHEDGLTLSLGANPQIENRLWQEALATATQVVLLERNSH